MYVVLVHAVERCRRLITNQYSYTLPDHNGHPSSNAIWILVVHGGPLRWRPFATASRYILFYGGICCWVLQYLNVMFQRIGVVMVIGGSKMVLAIYPEMTQRSKNCTSHSVRKKACLTNFRSLRTNRYTDQTLLWSITLVMTSKRWTFLMVRLSKFCDNFVLLVLLVFKKTLLICLGIS